MLLHSESDTQRLAYVLAQGCEGRCVIGLCGELGAGKTTLVRFFVASLGGTAEQVASPSFSLQNEYRFSGAISVEHWDLYRLSELPLELLEPPTRNVIRIVEWADRIPGYVDMLDLVVSITMRDSGDREVTLSGSQVERFATLVALT